MRAVSVEEASWWAAACAGDAQAFSRLFALHRDDVFRYARRLLDSSSDADDVAAMAFLELWRRREAVRVVEGSVKPWLLVTAGNLARNLRRGAMRWRAVLDQLPREHDAADPAEIAARNISRSRGDTPLGAALRRLHPTDLALLTLTVFEGYTVVEAAAALGIADATARSRLSRAKARLRHRLRPDLADHLAISREQS